MLVDLVVPVGDPQKVVNSLVVVDLSVVLRGLIVFLLLSMLGIYRLFNDGIVESSHLFDWSDDALIILSMPSTIGHLFSKVRLTFTDNLSGIISKILMWFDGLLFL